MQLRRERGSSDGGCAWLTARRVLSPARDARSGSRFQAAARPGHRCLCARAQAARVRRLLLPARGAQIFCSRTLIRNLRLYLRARGGSTAAACTSFFYRSIQLSTTTIFCRFLKKCCTIKYCISFLNHHFEYFTVLKPIGPELSKRDSHNSK